MKLVLILIGSMLVNNFVLNRFYGCCPFLGVSRKVETAFGMGMAVIFVITVASMVTYFVRLMLVAAGIEYLQTIAFILVIAVLVQVVESALRKLSPSLYQALGVYLPLITTNCAVLGVTISNITDGYNFIESMFSSLGVGLGFLLAMVLFAGVRSRIENCPAPAAFRGLPITLIAASIVALAFYGFSGVVQNLLL